MPLGHAPMRGVGTTAGQVATQLGTSITTHGTPDTYTSWVELSAGGAPFPVRAISVWSDTAAHYLSGVNCSSILDIGFGGTGSEQTYVRVQTGNSILYRSEWLIPISAPADTRVAMRIVSKRASMAMRFGVRLWGYSPWGQTYQTHDLWGVTSTCQGTQVALPGSTNTKGAWTELVASTPYDAKCILPFISLNTGVGANTRSFLDIAVGASSAEQIIVADMGFDLTTSEEVRSLPVPHPVNIPAGSRISARIAGTAINTGTNPDVSILALY